MSLWTTDLLDSSLGNSRPRPSAAPLGRPVGPPASFGAPPPSPWGPLLPPCGLPGCYSGPMFDHVLLPNQKVIKHWAGANAQIALLLPLGSLFGALVLPFGSLGSPVFPPASFFGPPSPSSASLGGSPPPRPPSAVLLRCPVWCFVSSNGPFELARALLNGYSESPRG